MMKKIQNLVVDTTAFIRNAPLHEIAENIVTIQEVVDEIINKRQLRRLVVLPYDLKIKNVYSEFIQIVTDFSKKTGDYPSLSATDIKLMALTYQMEKEHVGISHLREQPIIPVVKVTSNSPRKEDTLNDNAFRVPSTCTEEDSEDDASSEYTTDEEYSSNANENDVDLKLREQFATLECGDVENSDHKLVENILPSIKCPSPENDNSISSEEETDDGVGWVTPNNIQAIKKSVNAELQDGEAVKIACITTDFAMQNVLRQIGLNVSSLDGRVIKQLRTFILRCYTCFKTTSIMNKLFCPTCGNKTLKKVSVSLDETGKMQIHVNMRKPITTRGKIFSLPTFKGGKYSSNPILTEDQPMPQQRSTRRSRMKNNPLDPDYIAGYSPFVMRDVNSRAAYLGIRQGNELKHWMRKNPNESRRKRK